MNWFKNNRILVPFDFTDACVDAVKVALELAEKKEDVHVLHVLVNLPATYPYTIWDKDADDTRRDKARQSMKTKLAHLDVANVHLDIGIGNEGDTIADLAKEIKAGLIVIPSRGRAGVKRFLLGSVTERVVRLAACPVLVLKGDDSHAEAEH